MSVITLEGVTENGRIRLKSNIHLPDNITVFVIVPDVDAREVAHIYSPRLKHPEQVADFKMEVIEEPSDAGV